MKQTLLIIIGSALATALALKATAAIAEPAPAMNFSIVRTADLNLSTEAGRRQLDHRLVIAAREVCGTASDTDLAGKNQVRRCREDVLGQARASTAELVAAPTSERTIALASGR